jgi:hypothetical protein
MSELHLLQKRTTLTSDQFNLEFKAPFGKHLSLGNARGSMMMVSSESF